MNKTTKLKAFARRYWVALAGFAASTIFAIWFGFTVLADAIYFDDPRHQDSALRGWMTPRYIVLSYDLPRPTVFDILDLDIENPDGPRRMRDIAESKGISLDELTSLVRAEAQAYREQNK